jgi:DNA-binding transcriptional ArsR family regulator
MSRSGPGPDNLGHPAVHDVQVPAVSDARQPENAGPTRRDDAGRCRVAGVTSDGRPAHQCSRTFAVAHTRIEDFVMPGPEAVAAVADRLRMLAEPTRLTICVALAQGESNPGCLAELAGVAPAALSQQLSRLRLSGLVKARRDGQRVWYELVDAEVRDLVEHLLGATRTTAEHPAAADRSAERHA